MSFSGADRSWFEKAFAGQGVKGAFERLKRCTIGIMGAGGLGSNVASGMVRAGVGHLIVADPDRVEISNLNRQLFFVDQVGMLKVEALAETLKRINPYATIETEATRVTPANMPEIFSDADLLIEALDVAEEKALLIETWMMQRPENRVVGASGIAGAGNTRGLEVRKMGRLYICGDGSSDLSMGLSAGRVGIVAQMQVNTAVELFLERQV